jgi:hypothetical protein
MVLFAAGYMLSHTLECCFETAIYKIEKKESYWKNKRLWIQD